MAEGQTTQAQEHSIEDHPELVAYLMRVVPMGFEPFRLYSVVVPPGKSILEHDHPEYVALFYPESHPLPLVIGEIEYVYNAGDRALVYPGSRHSVPVNTTNKTRTSIALKVRPPTDNL